MPIYDYSCKECGASFEAIKAIIDSDEEECPECGAVAKKALAAPRVNVCGQDTRWIREAALMANPDGKPIDKEFRRNPTRDNYHEWLKVNKLRHLEDGEKCKPDPVDLSRVTDHVVKKHLERTKLSTKT